jgi:hypothetical protein
VSDKHSLGSTLGIEGKRGECKKVLREISFRVLLAEHVMLFLQGRVYAK